MEVNISHITCYKCGISFWVKSQYKNDLIECQNTFYCPNGHPQCFNGKTEAEKQREAKERYKRWYEQARAEIYRLANSNRALKGVITRQKKK